MSIIDPEEPQRTFPPAPVHPLAALATLLLDNFFGVVEIVDPLVLILTSLILFMICTVTTSLIQRHMARDAWGPAITKGLVMGVIAGVPFQVAGTAIGLPLLAWSGLYEYLKKRRPSY